MEQPSSPSLKKTEEKGVIVAHEVKCKVYVKVTAFYLLRWRLCIYVPAPLVCKCSILYICINVICNLAIIDIHISGIINHGMCVIMYVYMYMRARARPHTHTHTHTSIYIHVYVLDRLELFLEGFHLIH